MTPEEKAKELVDKFFQSLEHSGCYVKDYDGSVDYPETRDAAKDLVIIAVEEIIASNPVEWTKNENATDEETGEPCTTYTCKSTRPFWNSVKEQIQKL